MEQIDYFSDYQDEETNTKKVLGSCIWVFWI